MYVTNFKGKLTMVVRKKAARKKSSKSSAMKAMKAVKAKIAAMKKEHKGALKKAIAKSYKDGFAAGKKKAVVKAKPKKRKARKAKKK